MMNKYIILSERSWNKKLTINLSKKKQGNWTLIDEKENFNPKRIEELNPDIIFIPHWSYIIPESIYKNYECIVFHMTDLPYGRGGSPLQNLIERGHKTTKISAIRVEKEIDSGDIYLKKDLSLDGTAQQIFIRANKLIEEMIIKIIENDITPKPQVGTPVIFKRRTPKMSNISELNTVEKVFDHIRMLDAEGYPYAFIENNYFKFEFTNAQIENEKTITANVRISKK